ncbi:MAG TPA: EthD domain-containing protein, partial [Acidimicrobiia bacterium]|nr:EthD domain-containing protein [Acidimicrobiia bacterium]
MIVALWLAPGADVDALANVGGRVCIAVDDQPYTRDPVDVLLEVPDDYDVAPLIRLARSMDCIPVETHVQLDGPTSPSVTMVAFVRRAEGLTHEEFVEHWTQRHAPLALKHHIGLVRYVQHVVTDGGAVDGIAELTFASRKDYDTKFYDDETGKAIIREDVKKFI